MPRSMCLDVALTSLGAQWKLRGPWSTSRYLPGYITFRRIWCTSMAFRLVAFAKRFFRYFVHEQYAGISAFVNLPAEESERNAKMFAIGVLVPLSSGRLGKSWRHASKLKDLAQWVP